ncbi:MAG: hypothetical protein HS111_29190 [Kofleriaceae bacterium]|nr:hypothetical protein [Kofleriaceae bacterium]
MWTAGVVPAWRTSATIRDVIALDAGRALAVTTRGLDVVDLTAGGVSTHVVVPGSAAVRRVVHAGGRVLAYGQLGRATAAWTIDPATLAVTPVPLPDPAVVATKGYLELAVSPDDARLLTCSDDRWPTVRDAATIWRRCACSPGRGLQPPALPRHRPRAARPRRRGHRRPRPPPRPARSRRRRPAWRSASPAPAAGWPRSTRRGSTSPRVAARSRPTPGA